MAGGAGFYLIIETECRLVHSRTSEVMRSVCSRVRGRCCREQAEHSRGQAHGNMGRDSRDFRRGRGCRWGMLKGK